MQRNRYFSPLLLSVIRAEIELGRGLGDASSELAVIASHLYSIIRLPHLGWRWGSERHIGVNTSFTPEMILIGHPLKAYPAEVCSKV